MSILTLAQLANLSDTTLVLATFDSEGEIFQEEQRITEVSGTWLFSESTNRDEVKDQEHERETMIKGLPSDTTEFQLTYAQGTVKYSLIK